MKIILLGKPCSGKGTQAAAIEKEFGFKHVSTGQMLRNEIAMKTDCGKAVEEAVLNGCFASDNLILSIVQKRVAKKDCEKGFILDGVPRNINQAVALQKEMRIDLVIFLDLENSKVVARALGRRTCKDCGFVVNVAWHKSSICPVCGGILEKRADEKENVILQRIIEFDSQTKPLVDFFEKQGILEKIESDQSPEDMFLAIKSIIEKCERKKND